MVIQSLYRDFTLVFWQLSSPGEGDVPHTDLDGQCHEGRKHPWEETSPIVNSIVKSIVTVIHILLRHVSTCCYCIWLYLTTIWFGLWLRSCPQAGRAEISASRQATADVLVVNSLLMWNSKSSHALNNCKFQNEVVVGYDVPPKQTPFRGVEVVTTTALWKVNQQGNAA